MSTVPEQPKLVLGPESAGMLMTPEEFDAVEDFDEDYRYELIHGVLVVTPPPLDAEVGPNEMLGYWLLSYREHHPQGAALDLTLPERTIRTRHQRRRADRAIWAGLGRLPNRRREQPTIAVEFVSGGRRDQQRDYVEKRQEYMDAGIAEYWIIDRFRRTLTVVRPGPTGPQDVVIPEGQTYCPPLLPGFELPLAQLFAVADRLADEE